MQCDTYFFSEQSLEEVPGGERERVLRCLLAWRIFLTIIRASSPVTRVVTHTQPEQLLTITQEIPTQSCLAEIRTPGRCHRGNQQPTNLKQKNDQSVDLTPRIAVHIFKVKDKFPEMVPLPVTKKIPLHIFV